MPDVMSKKKPAPKSDFMLRLPPGLAEALARYRERHKVKPQEQDVIRTALEEFLVREGCPPEESD